MSEPIAYTYEADVYCPRCAAQRFGRGADGFIGTDEHGDIMRDGEGNEIGVIAPWDLDTDDAENGLYCGDCLCEILEPDNPATRAAAAGLKVHTYAYDRAELHVSDGAPGIDPPVILRMRNPRPDGRPDSHGRFVWDLELWDPYRPGPVVAIWRDFSPAPSLRPMEDPAGAARVMADAAALAAHALEWEPDGTARDMTDAEIRLADRLDEIASEIAR